MEFWVLGKSDYLRLYLHQKTFLTHSPTLRNFFLIELQKPMCQTLSLKIANRTRLQFRWQKGPNFHGIMMTVNMRSVKIVSLVFHSRCDNVDKLEQYAAHRVIDD